MKPSALTRGRCWPTLTVLLAFTLALLARPAAALADDKATPRPELKAHAQRPQQPDPVDEFFNRGPIPSLRIEFSKEQLDKLRQNARGYVDATVRETDSRGGGGPEIVYEKVGVHLKGGAGSYRDVDDKPGLTLNFGRPDGGQQSFHGLRKIHLNNSVQDPSYLSENLGNALFRDAGVPATRVTYARVWINGRDLGVFVLKEGFDDVFVRRFFPDGPTGTLYEGGFLRDVDGEMPARVNKAREEPARFKELVAAAQEGDPTKRRVKLEKVLDTDRFLTLLAVESLTAHWDGYCAQRNNYRVYQHPFTNKLIFLPHGTDQLFQHTGDPVMYGNAMVARAMIDSAEDRARCLDRVIEIRQKLFGAEALLKRIEAIDARLRPVFEQISPDAARQHKDQAEDFRRRVAERVRDVDRQLASMPRPLKFDTGGVANLSGATWEARTASGRVMLDRAEASGRTGLLHLRVEPGGGEGTASFRTTVPLTRGRYTFEGLCRTSAVVAPGGSNTGAGLRISGGQRPAGLSGDADWQRTEFTFEVNEDRRDVVLVCELKANKGEAWFDPDGLKLRRR